VATISRLLQIIGLFCRISSLLQGFFAKETYNLKEPSNRSHPIWILAHMCKWVILMYESHICHIYVCVIYIYVWGFILEYDSFIYTLNESYSFTNHSYDTYVWGFRLIRMCEDSYVWHDSWLIRKDMTHSYVWGLIRVTWLIHTFDMTYSYVWHDSFTCATWLIHTCDMTHSNLWYDAFIRVTWPMNTCNMTHIRDMTYSYARYNWIDW